MWTVEVRDTRVIWDAIHPRMPALGAKIRVEILGNLSDLYSIPCLL